MAERSEALNDIKTHDLFYADLAIARGLHETARNLEQAAHELDVSVLRSIITDKNPISEADLASRAVAGYTALAEAAVARVEANQRASEIFEKYLNTNVVISILRPDVRPIASMPRPPGPAEFSDDPRKEIKGTILEISAEDSCMILVPNRWAYIDGTRAYSVSLIDPETAEPNVYITFA